MCTVVITKPDVNAMVDLGWSQVFAANLGYTVKKSRSQWERFRLGPTATSLYGQGHI